MRLRVRLRKNEKQMERKRKASEMDFASLIQAIRTTHEHFAAQAVRAVNIGLTLRNWFIGAHIAEFELRGADRAHYGDRLLDELSHELRKADISNTGRRQLYQYLAFFHIFLFSSLHLLLAKHEYKQQKLYCIFVFLEILLL